MPLCWLFTPRLAALKQEVEGRDLHSRAQQILAWRIVQLAGDTTHANVDDTLRDEPFVAVDAEVQSQHLI